MKLFKSRQDATQKILLVLFFPVGICYFLTWAIKKLIVMNDKNAYYDDIDSDRERMEFVLAGEPAKEASYISEGVKLDFEFSMGGDKHIVKSGGDYIGYIDPRDVKKFEAFSATTAYIKSVEHTEEKTVVTAVFLK